MSPKDQTILQAGRGMNGRDQLVSLLRDEVDRARGIAVELCEARATNQRYLEAIVERDRLIQEYIETIQDLKVAARKDGDS